MLHETSEQQNSIQTNAFFICSTVPCTRYYQHAVNFCIYYAPYVRIYSNKAIPIMRTYDNRPKSIIAIVVSSTTGPRQRSRTTSMLFSILLLVCAVLIYARLSRGLLQRNFVGAALTTDFLNDHRRPPGGRPESTAPRDGKNVSPNLAENPPNQRPPSSWISPANHNMISLWPALCDLCVCVLSGHKTKKGVLMLLNTGVRRTKLAMFEPALSVQLVNGAGGW